MVSEFSTTTDTPVHIDRDMYASFQRDTDPQTDSVTSDARARGSQGAGQVHTHRDQPGSRALPRSLPDPYSSPSPPPSPPLSVPRPSHPVNLTTLVTPVIPTTLTTLTTHTPAIHTVPAIPTTTHTQWGSEVPAGSHDRVQCKPGVHPALSRGANCSGYLATISTIHFRK